MDWFRTYHGTATDPKWLAIARATKSTPAVVHSLWMALLDRASQARPRGNTDGVDYDALAAFYQVELEEVDRIRQAFRDRKMLGEDGWITAWIKRQPQREDDSAERVRKHRQRTETPEAEPVTQRNASKRSVTPPVKGRGEEIIDSEANASDAPAGAARPMTVYDTGSVLIADAEDITVGSARSFIAKLCREHGEENVTAAVEELRSRDPPVVQPRGFLTAMLKGKSNGKRHANHGRADAFAAAVAGAFDHARQGSAGPPDDG